jgi:hypothetical protein
MFVSRFALENTLSPHDRPQLSPDQRLSKVLPKLPRAKCGRRVTTLAVVISAWAFAVGAGWFILERHANQPGQLCAPPDTWPADTRLDRQVNRPMLMVFAHPHCPCTRATLSELERFLAQHSDLQQVTIVFTKPPGTPDGWEASDTLQRAKEIPGVTAVVDTDGVESRRFRALTSGEAIFYDARGRLEFFGGITPSRGHEGGNTGLAAIQAIIAGSRPAVDHSNVFGCPLGTPASEPCTKNGECRLKL